MAKSDWHENPGRKPRWPDDTRIEVQFRNGQVSRGIAKVGQVPRWEPWPWGESEFDVVRVRRI